MAGDSWNTRAKELTKIPSASKLGALGEYESRFFLKKKHVLARDVDCTHGNIDLVPLFHQLIGGHPQMVEGMGLLLENC